MGHLPRWKKRWWVTWEWVGIDSALLAGLLCWGMTPVVNHFLPSRGSYKKRLWNILSLSGKHTVFPNDQFIIFTLSSNTKGCIRDLSFSALNNSNWAARCEIIELTRIYSSRWSFFFLLGLWVMTIRVTTRARCKTYTLISHFSFLYCFMLCSAPTWSSSLRI